MKFNLSDRAILSPITETVVNDKKSQTECHQPNIPMQTMVLFAGFNDQIYRVPQHRHMRHRRLKSLNLKNKTDAKARPVHQKALR